MIKRVLGAILLTAMLAVPAQATLFVTVGNTAMSTEGIIDVFVRSNEDVDLDFFGLEFVITPGTPRQIAFAETQTFPELTSESNYVFTSPAGGSPYGGPSTSVFTNDTFVGGDSTDPPGPVSLVADTDYLLTRLQLVAGVVAPMVGDMFTISLVQSDATVFNSNLEAPITVDFDNSIVGTVTIVPEPSTIVLFLGMAGTFWGGRRLRRRRAG